MPGGRYRNHDPKTPFYDEATQPAPVERVRGVRDVMQEALNKKMWIYDPSHKEWYSPEEFNDKFGRISQGFEAFVAQVQIREPYEGVKAALQRLLDMQVRLDNYLVRIIDYYKAKK